MTKQVKLSESEIESCQVAYANIFRIGDWGNTLEGSNYWLGVYKKLRAMATHGTSDGKPWVEPEPEVIIDDKWAAVWPRRLVMVRDSDTEIWAGPYHLGSVDEDNYPFNMVNESRYRFCRPCTPDEIAAYEVANGKQEQPEDTNK